MKKRPLLWFFLLTFLITWGLAAFYFAFKPFFEKIFGEISVSNPVFVTAVWGPTIAAVLITSLTGGKAGLKTLLKKFIPPRVNILWYLLAILLIPGFGILLNLIIGQPVKFLELPVTGSLALMLSLLITGPLGEELGWRGFALPRMLEKRSAAMAGLFLGLIWGLWHLPTFFTPGLPQMGLQIPAFILTAISLSLIVTWVFVNTKQNVFIAFLLHYSVNFTFNLVGTKFLHVSVFLIVIALLLVIIFGKNLKK